MTESTFAVRKLGAGDTATFREMLAVMGEAFEDVPTYTRSQPGDDYVARLLSGGSFVALAAVEGGRVIGGLAAYELQKFEQARSEFYIYDLAVDAAHRRKGVATALIESLKPIAAARGAYVIFVQADPPDEPAIRLYTKLGIREDVLHFDIPVR